MQNLNDEKLFKLVEEHFGVTYFAKNDAVLHNETGHYNPAYLYRDFAQAVTDAVLKDLVRECEELKQQTITYARDVELLDWLEGEVCDSHTGVTINRINHREAGRVIERGFRLRRFHKDYEVKPTLRAAIAAAEEKAEHGIPERPGKAGRTTPEESTKPYPTTYLNAGLDAVYITVRAGEAQCQRAIPREIVLNVEAPEQRIGGIVLKQIKVVDSINAAAKEKKDAQDT